MKREKHNWTVSQAVLRPAGGVWIVLCALLIAGPVAAQGGLERTAEPFLVCRLPTPESVQGEVSEPSHSSVHSGSVVARASSRHEAAATFVVTYEGFSPEAEAAFQAAVDVWEAHLTSPVPIRIRARWTPLGSSLLGSAGPFLVRNFDRAPVPNTWYPYALADALAGRDLFPGATNYDIQADFNSAYSSWYLGTDGDGPANQVELFTVVLHELGHGLGFIGSASVENELGTFGLDQAPSIPFVYDRFAEDSAGRDLLDTDVYPSPSMALGDVLTEAAFLGGNTVKATYGEPAPLHTPPSWNAGSSFSHFDETAFPADSADGLMTPLLAAGEKKENPGRLLCAALQDLGWTLAPACAALIPDAPEPPDEPLPDVFTFEAAGPNPFTGSTRFSLTTAEAQRVQAWLFDAAGRRLRTLLDNEVGEGSAQTLDVIGEGLPAGVYFVRVVGEQFETTRILTLIR